LRRSRTSVKSRCAMRSIDLAVGYPSPVAIESPAALL
jgi:hypothetical protein